MTDHKRQAAGPTEAPGQTPSATEPIKVIVQDGPRRHQDEDIGLAELWGILWQRKWLMIASAALFAVLSVAYALNATEWFRAQILLAPAKQNASAGLAGQFGGLAGLAGIEVPTEGISEPLAVLRSREFAREFISDFNLLPVFYADQYDSEKKAWIDPETDNHPDIRDAVKFFQEQVLNVSELDNGMVSLSIEWTDSQLAADWATVLVKRLNERTRERSLNDALVNVEYLQTELADARIVTIQQSIGRLMEAELQKVMMARGRPEFAFRVIDPAVQPKERSRPRRALIAVFGTVLGGLLGFFVALFLGIRQRYRLASTELD